MFHYFEQKKILNKKHSSQKLGDHRICTFWDIWQFFLKPMALRYMEKLTFVWKCTYSAIPKFLWQISSCKIGVQNGKKMPFSLLMNFTEYWCFYMNVDLGIIIYILVVIMTTKMVIMIIITIIMIIMTIIIWMVHWG